MKRLLSLCVLFCLGLPASFAAPTWLEVSDAGQYVIVLAKGVEFTSSKVKTSKQFLLIELEGVTLKKERVSITDKTISKLETVGGQSSSRLYIEIKKGAPTPLQLVPLVRVEPVAEGLRVMIPRDLEVAHAVAPAVAPAVKAPEPAAAPPLLPEAIEQKTAASQPAPQERREAALPPIIIQNSGSSVSIWFLVILLLGGAGAAVWLKKKQAGSPDESRIKIITSHALDGKNKLVLLTAGKKELLLSVSEGGTRLIKGWKQEEPERSYESELQEAQAKEFQFEAPDRTEFARTVRQDPPKNKLSNEYWRLEDVPKPGALRSVPKPSREAEAAPKGDDAPSDTVAGILRLRKKQNNEEPQDDEWTRELLAMASSSKLSS